jgi:hypothetical protein
MCQNIAMGFTGEHLNPSPTKKPAPLNDPAAQAASFNNRLRRTVLSHRR